MARRGFVTRRGVARRETLWVGITETRTTLVAANTAALILSLNAAALALRPFTITRTIWRWSTRSDQTAASENWATAVGAAVVSDQASAIGVTAVPTPFTDLPSDLWFAHSLHDGRFLFISGIGVDRAELTHSLVDSRAQRKVEDGEDVIFSMENDSLGAGTVSYLAGRMLVKLH